MRRLSMTARSILIPILSGRSAAVVGAGLLAVAAASARPGGDLRAIDPAAIPAAAPVRAVAEAPGPVMRALVFETPVRGHGVNSRFGPRRLGGEGPSRPHRGVDFAAPLGTAVFASAEGVALRTGYQAGGYGHFIELAHPNGMTTLYAHLSRVDVASGARVAGGDRIGLVGSTGYSTGPHLHFEARRAGVAINPDRVLGRRFQVVAGPG